MPAMLDARGIRVVRGGKAILRGVNLEASRGDVVGVLGPSGAGKSSLFRAIVGEVLPDAGTVMLDGADVTREPLWKRARRGVGYVPQEPSVLWDLTVRENLAAFRAIAGLGRDAGGRDAEPQAAAARVGLEGRLEVRAGELSGGERRRLELARAITRPVKVLVCDEPFAGVDPAGAERLGSLLRSIAEGGATVLLADHHVAEALRVCTRAVLLLDGACEVSGSTGEFRDHPLVQGRYLGTWQPASLGEATPPEERQP
jgi:lipopolysaccharide export system ATP-binding protein